MCLDEVVSIISSCLGVVWDTGVPEVVAGVVGDDDDIIFRCWYLSKLRMSAVQVWGPNPQCFAVLNEKSQY